MSTKKNATDYLLRDMPRPFWKEVKMAAFDYRLSIKDFIVEAIKSELKRKKSREEDNETPEDPS